MYSQNNIYKTSSDPTLKSAKSQKKRTPNYDLSVPENAK